MASDRLNYIGGQWVESTRGETYQTENPAAPSESVATYQDSGKDDATAAVEAAADAAADWRNTPGPARGKILRNAAIELSNRKEELTELLTAEEGKTLAEAGGEVQRAIDIFYYYAEKARELGGTRKGSSSPRTNLYTRQEPVGVVSLITPWNYPIAIPAWKLAPALAAGCTAVMKPAKIAPGVAIALFEALDQAGLPDGAANVVTGSGRRIGTPMIEHPAVDAVSFTGSTQVGLKIYDDATDGGKRVQTEMGGKNPTIVTESADIDHAADLVSAGAFGVTGQACTACSRAIVQDSVADEFIDAIVSRAEAIEVGPGTSADMGPQASESELTGTLDFIETAKQENTLVSGGNSLSGGDLGDGYYVEPTIFTDVESDDTIACDEVFGPVLSVLTVEDFEEAMEVANDVEFGLSSSIVTNNHVEAERFIDEIEAGVAKVNDKTTGLELHVPFGGFKQSSSETWREQGDAGLDFYTIEKTIYETY